MIPRSLLRGDSFKFMIGLIKKLIGTKNEREIKRIRPVVDQINSFEPQYEKLTNAELRAKTDEVHLSASCCINKNVLPF